MVHGLQEWVILDRGIDRFCSPHGVVLSPLLRLPKLSD